MNGRLYNNLGICSLAISFVLQHVARISLSKVLLIVPIITNADLLNYLARKNSNIRSIEQLMATKPECFSNFNARYYDGLLVSINSVQFLTELGALELIDGEIFITENFHYDKSMGKRAKKIFDASSRIAVLLNSDTANLYSNLRIEL